MAAHRSALRPLALLLAAVALVLALAACGSDDKGSASTNTDKSSTTAKPEGSGDEETPDTPDIVAKDFSLTSATVKAGEDVYVENQGTSTHTVTADDGSFDTGKIDGGKDGEFKAPAKAGMYTYHCSIHSSMTGTLTVQ